MVVAVIIHNQNPEVNFIALPSFKYRPKCKTLEMRSAYKSSFNKKNINKTLTGEEQGIKVQGIIMVLIDTQAQCDKGISSAFYSGRCCHFCAFT